MPQGLKDPGNDTFMDKIKYRKQDLVKSSEVSTALNDYNENSNIKLDVTVYKVPRNPGANIHPLLQRYTFVGFIHESGKDPTTGQYKHFLKTTEDQKTLEDEIIEELEKGA